MSAICNVNEINKHNVSCNVIFFYFWQYLNEENQLDLVIIFAKFETNIFLFQTYQKQ